MPDLNELAAQGWGDTMWYCFPNFFVLPMYSSATSYRFRPLGPEECRMDMWSLTRYPPGEEPETPPMPELWDHDDARWPPIPTQDFSNLPKQQVGLHARTFEYMRLSERNEGHISNYQRVLDGFLAGVPDREVAGGAAEGQPQPSRAARGRDRALSRAGSGMADVLTSADVAEGVRAAIATYTQALDDGRTDDVVATFCPDGSCEMPGLGVVLAARTLCARRMQGGSRPSHSAISC